MAQPHFLSQWMHLCLPLYSPPKSWGDFSGESGTWSIHSFGWLLSWQLWASVTSSHNDDSCGAASSRTRCPSHLQRDRDVFLWPLIPESTGRPENRGSWFISPWVHHSQGDEWWSPLTYKRKEGKLGEMTLASLCFVMQMPWGEVHRITE